MSRAESVKKDTEKKGKNKGEWSEAYVFLKLLSDGKIYVADEKMNKIGDDACLKIISVDPERKKGGQRYCYCIDREKNEVVIKLGEEEQSRHPVSEFADRADRVWDLIKANKGYFYDEEIIGFLDSVNAGDFKAPSNNGKEDEGNADIVLETEDYRSGMVQKLGFSIKSNAGANPSFLNPNIKGTNFVYKLTGDVNDDVMKEFNKICNKKIKGGCPKEEVAIGDRMRYLKERGIGLEFLRPAGDVANMNLTTCCGKEMPAIVGEMLWFFYYYNEGKKTSVKEATDHVVETNPACYFFNAIPSDCKRMMRDVYYYKIEHFLYEVFTGLRLTYHWSGRSKTNGGYIQVKKNGDVVTFLTCYSDEFKDYLMNSTELQSTDCKKFRYMKIYPKDGEYHINLSLSIRIAEKRSTRSENRDI